MTSYRFYYLSEGDHIIDAEWVYLAEDTAAMALAVAKLLARRDSRGIEVWQGKRRVDAVAKSFAAKQASVRKAA